VLGVSARAERRKREIPRVTREIGTED